MKISRSAADSIVVETSKVWIVIGFAKYSWMFGIDFTPKFQIVQFGPIYIGFEH